MELSPSMAETIVTRNTFLATEEELHIKKIVYISLECSYMSRKYVGPGAGGRGCLRPHCLHYSAWYLAERDGESRGILGVKPSSLISGSHRDTLYCGWGWQILDARLVNPRYLDLVVEAVESQCIEGCLLL